LLAPFPGNDLLQASYRSLGQSPQRIAIKVDRVRLGNDKGVPKLPQGIGFVQPGGFMPPVRNAAGMTPAVQPGGFMPPVRNAAGMTPAVQPGGFMPPVRNAAGMTPAGFLPICNFCHNRLSFQIANHLREGDFGKFTATGVDTRYDFIL
jgi:hypothetical protein